MLLYPVAAASVHRLIRARRGAISGLHPRAASGARLQIDRVGARAARILVLQGRAVIRIRIMSINSERDIEANLQIGPTDQGMVRLYILAGDLEIPMDFEPEEAEEIAEELRAAAATARRAGPRR